MQAKAKCAILKDMDELSKRAIESKTDEEKFYSFAMDNRRFIKRCAFRVCKRFISESEDEWSIALIAFYEAVRKFDLDRGSFKSFAFLVIKRRLMDYFDTQTRRGSELAADPYIMDGQIDSEDPSAFELEVSRNSALKDTSLQPGTTPLEDEVEAIRQRIAPYGFDLYEIGGCSPKAAKTKAACARVIEEIVTSPELVKSMRHKKNLPYVKLLELEGVNRKVLEKYRKYLIAAVEIRLGDFPGLKEYIVRLR